MGARGWDSRQWLQLGGEGLHLRGRSYGEGIKILALEAGEYWLRLREALRCWRGARR